MLLIDPKTHERPANCEKHGDYVEKGGSLFTTIRWFGCSRCNEELRHAEEAQKAGREEAARQQRIESRLNAAGIPQAFRERDFSNFEASTREQRYALEVAQEFGENFCPKHLKAGTFLVFAGDPGTGKSHLAIAAAQAMMNRGTAMYLRAADVIRRVRATWRRDSPQTEEDVLHMLGYELDLLIIDEVGVQRGTDDEQIILFDVLDRRYSEMRPTILLTNLAGVAFVEFIGPRIMDRLRERAVFVPFKWASHRGKK